MSEPEQRLGSGEFGEFSQAEKQSALFAQLVMQQSNMAMMLLGRVADPQTGQTTQDLEAARFFIDQLEVLHVKTKGNLTKEEEALIKQSLMALRLEFVAAVEAPAAKPEEKTASAPATEAAPVHPQNKTAPAEEAASEEPSRKRYSKKFSL